MTCSSAILSVFGRTFSVFCVIIQCIQTFFCVRLLKFIGGQKGTCGGVGSPLISTV